ncbi:MAG: bifunctional serine/threonine-protein kinase/formylglycine-generating enzyme family protein [Gammaproteobacteria bacterium]|nr:bifunctional serine/threonine-protein kinase/formylglycine-generating enzyme family protein [Gammaproteobacteria bacterium]
MTDYLHALPSGYRIEEYELVRVLGSGGFGITYLGYDHHLDKAVAVKEYLPNDLAVRGDNQSVLPKSTEDTPDYEWGLTRFLSEAQTLARFDHRHIIKVHRFFRAHGTGYIVMEYAEGETLSDLLQRKGTLTEAELKQLLFPILDGLEVVHGADFLHRDIKPKNIVIRDDGSPVLIDFGSARQAVAGKSRSVTAIVTPGYAPIEQYSAKGHQGIWTDIYGLGAVCYRCLTGEPPDDATERLREDPLIPATQRCKGKAGKAFLEAIDRALRVDEGERPESVAEWREMLSNKIAAPAYRRIEETEKLADQSSLSAAEWQEILLAGANRLIKERRKKGTAKSTTQPSSSPSQGRRDGPLSKLMLAGLVGALVGGAAYWRFAEVRQAAAIRTPVELKTAAISGRELKALAEQAAMVGEMVSIPGGTFSMGDLSGEGITSEKPVHAVTIRPFKLGKYEVTFEQWDACVADGGCNGYSPHDGVYFGESGRGNRPVLRVSWNEVQSFIDWLNNKTSGNFRLPTEAEWEYAARAGSTTKYSWGDDIGSNRANCHNDYCGESWEFTAPVGSFPANAWGLHDMYGNVGELVQDCWKNSYEGAPTDGSAWMSGDCYLRVVRGNHWYSSPRYLRSAYRTSVDRTDRFDGVGFRLAQDE